MRSELVSVALGRVFIQEISRPQVLTLFSSGRRRQRARPRSLCASYRTLQTTQPSSPAHPATHTSSSARLSPDTLSLMLPGVESLGSTCTLMGKPSTAEFLQPEHRNHRSVSPTDGAQLGACRFKPCAQRELAPCHPGAPRCLRMPRGAFGALSKPPQKSGPADQRPGSSRPMSPTDQSRPCGPDACGALGGL